MFIAIQSAQTESRARSTPRRGERNAHLNCVTSTSRASSRVSRDTDRARRVHQRTDAAHPDPVNDVHVEEASPATCRRLRSESAHRRRPDAEPDASEKHVVLQRLPRDVLYSRLNRVPDHCQVSAKTSHHTSLHSRHVHRRLHHDVADRVDHRREPVSSSISPRAIVRRRPQAVTARVVKTIDPRAEQRVRRETSRCSSSASHVSECSARTFLGESVQPIQLGGMAIVLSAVGRSLGGHA